MRGKTTCSTADGKSRGVVLAAEVSGMLWELLGDARAADAGTNFGQLVAQLKKRGAFCVWLRDQHEQQSTWQLVLAKSKSLAKEALDPISLDCSAHFP